MAQNGRVQHSPVPRGIARNDPRRKLLPTPRIEQDEPLPASSQPLPLSSSFTPLHLRRMLRTFIHWLIYTIIHTLFSIYLRIRRTKNAVSYALASVLFYHHRTPELIARDTTGLPKRPQHLSVILTLGDETRVGPELERLVDEVADLAAWSTCAGIPVLSVYEKTGILKKYLPQIHQHVLQKFTSYFGRNHPALTVTAPHQESIETPSPVNGVNGINGHHRNEQHPCVPHIQLIFISSQDGRDSLVDLTKTLADMSQRGKLSPHDIQPDLIHTELVEGIFPEPDLLIVFSPYIVLSGYPPWHLRLTEIFCLKDNEGVGYQVFLKALRNFAKAEFRRGK